MASAINGLNVGMGMRPSILGEAQFQFPQQASVSRTFNELADMIAMLSEILQATQGMSQNWSSMMGPQTPPVPGGAEAGNAGDAGNSGGAKVGGSNQSAVVGDVGDNPLEAIKDALGITGDIGDAGNADKAQKSNQSVVVGDIGEDPLAAIKDALG